MQRLIIDSRVGTAATLGVVRDGEPLSLRVRVTTWPTQLLRPDFARSELDKRHAPRPSDDEIDQRLAPRRSDDELDQGREP